MTAYTHVWAYRYQCDLLGCSLGFLWTLVEHSIPIQKQDQALRHSEIDAVRSPTMAGGLFSVNREYFWHIGGYDTDFGFWGTENLEFSFRIWQVHFLI